MPDTPSSIARNANNIKRTIERRESLAGQYPEEWNALARTRKEAQNMDPIPTHYFPATYCPKGHLDRRFTQGGNCFKCLAMDVAKKDSLKKMERAAKIIANEEVRICPECKEQFLMTPEDRKDKIYCSKKCAGAESKRAYVLANPEKRKEQSSRHALKAYRSKTIEERRKDRNKWNKNMGPRRKAAHSVRTRINMAIRDRMNGETRSWRLKDIGFDVDKYMTHMESLWEPGMTWENYGYGPGKWVRDEIIPMCSFDMTDPSQARKCMKLENLRPLWFEENARKAKNDRKLSINS